MSLIRVAVAGLIGLAISCKPERQTGPGALAESLATLALPAPGQPSAFATDEARNEAVWGEPSLRVLGVRVGSPQVRLSLARPAATVSAEGAAVGFRPVQGPLGFASWGPGEPSGSAVIYSAPGGEAAVVQHAQPTRLKEDIVLTRPLGDALAFSWQLQLSEGLGSAVDADGSIVFTVEGRVRFRIPAPVLKAADGRVQTAAAWYTLASDRLTLTAVGLETLEYPISIDPTLTVTTAAEFGNPGNFEGGSDVDGAGQRVRRAKSHHGLSAWTATSSFMTGRNLHQTVAYNGYLYVIGGSGSAGARFSDVQYAPIQSDGTLGPFSATTSLAAARHQHASVAYNGYLYVIGGDSSGATASIVVAPINSNGTLGTFSAATPLPAARQNHRALAWNGHLYVVGGFSAGMSMNDVLVAPIRANGNLGAFTTASTFTTGRQNPGAVAWNGRLYVVGGQAASALADVQMATLGADGTLGAFTTVGTMATARGGHVAVALNGKLIVAGGNGGVSLSSVEAATIRADGRLDAFAPNPSLPAVQFDCGAATWNGRLYLTGGGSGWRNDVLLATATNGALGAFTTLTPLTVARDGLSGVAYNGRLYAVAGTGLQSIESAPINSDGTLGTFRAEVAVPPSAARYLSCSVAYNGFLYVTGGNSSGGPLNDVQRASIAADTGALSAFQASSTFALGRRGHGCAAYNGHLYIVGGSGSTDYADVQHAPINADGTLGSFLATSSLPSARWGIAAVAYNGYLYVLGGYSGTYYDTVMRAPINANGTLGAFSQVQTFSGARYVHSAAAHHGYLVVMGGENTGVYLSDVQVAPINADGSIGSFAAVATLSSPRERFGAAVWGRHLYVFGGNTGAAALSDVQAVPLAASGGVGTFAATSPFASARGGAGAAVHNGYVYIAGGISGITPLSDVQFAPVLADGTLGAFAATSSFSTSRAGLAAVTHGGYLYVTGGKEAPYLSDVQVASINANGTLGAFSATTSFATGRSYHAAVAHRGYLYIVGGEGAGATPLADVQFAPINANGTLGAFSATTALPSAREGATAHAYNGYLFVIGGANATANLAEVVAAPINSNGTLGAFSRTAFLPRARVAHASVAADGYLYVFGGNNPNLTHVDFAPINSNGTLGDFTGTTPLANAAWFHSAVHWAGRAYLLGGHRTGVHTNEVLVAPLLAPAAVGRYSRLVDLGAASTATSLTVNGAATQGSVRVDYRTAGPNFQFGPLQTRPNVTLGSPVALGGNGIRYLQLGLTLDDTLAAGVNPDAVNERDTTDFSVLYTADPTLTPASVNLPPRGSQTFTCTGGVGPPFTWAVSPNNSGGAVTSGGVYTAGATGSVSDTVTCADATTATGYAVVTVGPGVSINPVAPAVPPRGPVAFAAAGGSGSGYTYVLVTNNSGGSVSSGGAYLAGATGNVTDTVRVTDSLGNTATTTVTVGPPLVVSPSSVTLSPRGTQTFTSTGGSGTGISWSFVTNNSGGTIGGANGLYQAGPNGNVTDTVRVTDSLGNTADRTVTVTAGVTLAPPSATRPPRGAVTFAASGGSGTGYVWSLSSNASGGSVTAGAYTAGATGSVTDVVLVTDSLGNTASASVTVTAAVTPTPASATVPPRGGASFSAAGGSGINYVWSLLTNSSGGSITAGGSYTAGSTGSVTDVVRVTDSLGNTANVNVTVTPGITINPSTPSTPPSGTINFSATNGSGSGFTWALQSSGSGAPTITPAGMYVAGTGMGSDVVRVTDSLGNVATTTVTVTNALAITPSNPTLFPRQPQTFSATGGSGTGFMWSLVTNNSGANFNTGTAAYVAGPTGGVVDTLRVTDSLGNMATTNISVSAGITVAPSGLTRAPGASATFTASGGSGSGYIWSLLTNASGGTIGMTTGAYVAGRTGSVTDVVQVTDSLGNTGTSQVTVSAAVSTPSIAVYPGEVRNLVATGGSSTGYLWSIITNASNATVTLSGLYTAGRTGGVTDVVEVVDSLGNTSRMNVNVGPGVTVMPSMPSTSPRGMISFTAMGGSNAGFSWVLITNRSAGVVIANTGDYTAGATAGVVDVLRVTDSVGNTATTDITVTDQIVVTPQMPRVVPNQQVPFRVMNSSGTAVWSLSPANSQGTIDSATGLYTAGAIGGTLDTVRVTDGLGNMASTVVTVGTALSLTPAGQLTVAPLESRSFSAMGGLVDGGYTFSVSGGSGATIDSATGAYRAGRLGNTADTVTVTDGVGGTARTTVMVTAALAISPGVATVDVGQQQAFTARNGSGQGYVWSMRASPSGGSIDSSTGAYTAGNTGNVTDEVQLTDSLGAVAVASVDVRASGGVSNVPVADRGPANGWACGCGSTSPGPVAAAIGLALLLQRRRRRWMSAALVVMVAPLAAGAAPVPYAKRPSVAVLEVELTTQGEKLDTAAFGDVVISAVDSVQTFRVIGAKEISTILGIERQKQLMGCSDESNSCLTEVANALGSDYVMHAAIGRVGENYLVSVRLINGATNKVTSRASLQAKSANALLEALWKATQETLDGYGASLPPTEAQEWASKPKRPPPAALVAAEENPSRFGVAAFAVAGYQPLSNPGKRGSIGAQVDLTFRKSRLDLAAGVIIAPSPGARITGTWAILAKPRGRIDAGLRLTAFPGLGYYGGGATAGGEFALHDNFAIVARVAVEAYPVTGSVVLALLGGVGVAARF